MSLCLEMYRSMPRYVAAKLANAGAKAAGTSASGLIAGPVAPLRLVDRPEPSQPGPGWNKLRPRLSGICGSDLSAISGGTSFYFSALVSMPFTPGHEVVADVVEGAGKFGEGSRVIVDPILSCKPRGIEPVCEPCATGELGLCERVTGGHVGPGLQTGYCSDTSGGWSHKMVAHDSQLFSVPEAMADETAVIVEPAACAIRSVRKARVPQGGQVLIIGSGTVGLLTLMALRKNGEAGRILMVAKHAHQAELARHYGATEVFSPEAALGAVRRSSRAFRLDPERSAPFLLGGVDTAFECAGTSASLDLALRVTKAGGRVVLTGMPKGADLSPAWYRELELTGAYSGTGAFEDALELVQEFEAGKLVGPAYPLSRWREALEHALHSGSLGATKIVFDPRLEN